MIDGKFGSGQAFHRDPVVFMEDYSQITVLTCFIRPIFRLLSVFHPDRNLLFSGRNRKFHWLRPLIAIWRFLLYSRVSLSLLQDSRDLMRSVIPAEEPVYFSSSPVLNPY